MCGKQADGEVHTHKKVEVSKVQGDRQSLNFWVQLYLKQDLPQTVLNM